MTTPTILALAVTVFTIILIVVDKPPFGVPPLLALLLTVVLGVMNIKTTFGGSLNSTIVMLTSFMATIAALQKTSLSLRFKETMFNFTARGGLEAYVLLILVIMLDCSPFGTGSATYYILIIGLLSNFPDSKALSLSRVLTSADFAANHPLFPFNMALQYGIVIAVLQNVGTSTNVDLMKFSLVDLCLSPDFFAWCALAYHIMPDHPITNQKADENGLERKATLNKQEETITCVSFVIVVVGMVLQSKIGSAGYAITALTVGVLLTTGIMSSGEIRSAISAPITLMPASVTGIADALGNIGLTGPVGQTVTNMFGSNVDPFVLVLVLRILTSMLTTLIGSIIDTVYAFAPIAIATCVNLRLDPTATTAAIAISGWYEYLLPIDSIPAMTMGAGKYKIGELWEFMIPRYFIRLFVLTVGATILLPMK